MSNVLSRISILVDYAHEPESMRQLLQTLDLYRQRGEVDKILHIYSATGSGRDVWKRPLMSKISGDFADIIMITAEDHDAQDDLAQIQAELANQVRQGKRVQEVLLESDRRLAFRAALNYVKNGLPGQKVLLVSTAMGSQQGMETAAGVIDWDERRVWAEEWDIFKSHNRI